MSEAPSGYCGPGTEINEQIMRQANEPLIGRSSLSELNLWTIKGKVVFRLQEYAALVRARIGIPWLILLWLFLHSPSKFPSKYASSLVKREKRDLTGAASRELERNTGPRPTEVSHGCSKKYAGGSDVFGLPRRYLYSNL